MPLIAAAKDPTSHYDATYFRWQGKNGRLAGEANRFKFAPFIQPGSRIVDFGCGDGSLLLALGGGTGIEINEHAISVARASGLTVEHSLRDLPDVSADVIVSNHALEHVEDPLKEMREMHRVLAPGGKIVIVVPCDKPSYRFRLDDPDFHLFSYSASNLGNLARAAGFRVIEARVVAHAWPPKWPKIQAWLGWQAFHFASRVWARIGPFIDLRVRRIRAQVRVVAEKQTAQ